eukprot:gene4926-6140_t
MEIEKIFSKEKKLELNPECEKVMSKKILGIKPTESLNRALELMVLNGIKRLPVVDEQYELLGMVTDKDIRSYSKSNLDYSIKEFSDFLKSIKISDILPDKHLFIKIKEDERITEAAKLMQRNDINGLPVIDKNDKLTGIITRSDILDQLIRILEPIKTDK